MPDIKKNDEVKQLALSIFTRSKQMIEKQNNTIDTVVLLIRNDDIVGVIPLNDFIGNEADMEYAHKAITLLLKEVNPVAVALVSECYIATLEKDDKTILPSWYPNRKDAILCELTMRNKDCTIVTAEIFQGESGARYVSEPSFLNENMQMFFHWKW